MLLRKPIRKPSYYQCLNAKLDLGNVKECAQKMEMKGRIVLLAQIQRMAFGIGRDEGISKVIVLRKAQLFQLRALD